MIRILNKIEKKIEHWTLFGPLLALMALTLIALKGSPANLTLAIVAILGLPLCWILQTRGLAISFGLLAGVAFYQYFALSNGEQIWHLGMSASLGLTFLITTFAAAESKDSLQPLSPEKEGLSDKKSKVQLNKVRQEHADEMEVQKGVINELKKELTKSQAQAKAVVAEQVEKQQELIKTQKLLDHEKQERTKQANINSHAIESLKIELNKAQTETTKALQNSTQEQAKIEQERQEYLKQKNSHVDTTNALRAELTKAAAEATKAHASVSQLQQQILQERQEGVNRVNVANKSVSDLRFEINKAAAEATKANQSVAQLQEQIVQERQDHVHRLNQNTQTNNDLRSELNKAIAEASQVQQSVIQLHEQLSQQQKHLDQSTQTIATLKIEYSKAKAELAEAEQRTSKLQKDLLEQCDKNEEQNVLSSKSIEELQNELKKAHCDIASTNTTTQDLIRQQKIIDELNHLVTTLAEEKNQLDASLLSANEAKDNLLKQTQPLSTLNSEEITELQRSLRRTEGLLTQLRQQFSEKSSFLDETRKMLFRSEERLLTLQRDQHEQQQFSIADNEIAFEKYFYQIEKEYSNKCKQLQHEIDVLEDLITSLTMQKDL